MMRIFPRPRPRERRPERNEIEVIRDKITHEEREVCHGKSWEQRRQDVWTRDNGKCGDCGGSVPLHTEKDPTGKLLRRACEIHHRAKRKMGGSHRDDRTDNLITLCWRCHGVRTRRGE